MNLGWSGAGNNERGLGGGRSPEDVMEDRRERHGDARPGLSTAPPLVALASFESSSLGAAAPVLNRSDPGSGSSRDSF